MSGTKSSRPAWEGQPASLLRKTAAGVLGLVTRMKNSSIPSNKFNTPSNNRGGEQPNKELSSTITDLTILANLALYHSRRIPAAVYYRLYERTHDISALDSAIKHESLAIDAWRQIVTSAGDYYADTLKMGVSVAGLCGHWKDELVMLEANLSRLQR
jgi:hypothetical protein